MDISSRLFQGNIFLHSAQSQAALVQELILKVLDQRKYQEEKGKRIDLKRIYNIIFIFENSNVTSST